MILPFKASKLDDSDEGSSLPIKEKARSMDFNDGAHSKWNALNHLECGL